MHRGPAARPPPSEEYDQTPDTLRDLAIGLGRVGEVQRDLGDPQVALAACTEALQLDRRRAEEYGQTPDTLRSLAISLGQVGEVQRDLGDLQAALAACTEALQLDRRRAEEYDQTPDTLRDLAISLGRVGMSSVNSVICKLPWRLTARPCS